MKLIQLTFLNKIESAYQIVYKTSLVGEQVAGPYSNGATLHDEIDSNNPKQLSTYSKTVTPKFPGEYIKKFGEQTYDDPYVTWTVNINRSQSHITNAVLKDTLSANQILQRDSFRLYKLSANPNGTYPYNNETTGKTTNLTPSMLVDPSHYELEFTSDGETGEDSFTLRFKEPIEHAYVLQYKAYLNASDENPYSNKVSLNGQSSVGSGVTGEQTKEQKASFSAGAGGKVFQTGTAKIKIKKVDVDTGEALEGAVFELWDENGITMLEELTTNDDGEAETTKKYKYGKYLLKEVKPPDGYISNSEYKAGKVIVFNKDGTDDAIFEVDNTGKKTGNPYTFTNKKGNWVFELTKVDEDNPTQMLAGAKFKLQKETAPGSNDYVDVVPQPTNLTTNEFGKLRLSRADVEMDVNYQLVEIVAPTGYELDPTPIPFKIKADQTILGTAMMKNKNVTVGSVQLFKVDDVDATALPGAQFKLEYNQGGTGNWVEVEQNKKYTTNTSGQIEVTNLKGGEYRFTEVTAPDHYQLDNSPLHFVIVENGKQVILAPVENKLIPGSVKLTKIRKGNPSKKLQGAVFELKDDKGKVISTHTTNGDGVIFVDGLRPGNYQFVETKAPSGHLLNRTPIEFTIVRSQEEMLILPDFENVYDDDDWVPPIPPGGGGGNPPAPPKEEEPKLPEDPKKPVDPNKPVDPAKPLDPRKRVIIKKPLDPEKLVNPEKPVDPEKPLDPNKPVVPEQPSNSPNNDEDPQQSGSSSGNVAGDSDEDYDSLNKNNRRLSEEDELELNRRNQVQNAQDAQNGKKNGMLPQTGETLPFTPFIGLLFIMAAFVVWFRKGKRAA